MTTNPTLDQAREWAEYAKRMGTIRNDARAAIDLIASLPDEWIDAAQLRDVINGQLSSYPHGTAGHHVAEEIACKLQALFPAPQPRPQDVPEEEPWIVECYGDRHVGTRDPHDSPHWALARMDGTNIYFASDHEVTLLYRLVPEDHHPTDAEDKPEPAQPHPEDIPAGELWLVEVDGHQDAAQRELPGAAYPWWLMRGWRVSDKDITLVSRLVPEKEQ